MDKMIMIPIMLLAVIVGGMFIFIGYNITRQDQEIEELREQIEEPLTQQDYEDMFEKGELR